MKTIRTGNIYKIYDNDMKTFDALPAQCYRVRFDGMSGFYLEKHSDLETKEEKIYGTHNEKVEKVLNSFSKFNRSLGVILSGDKGIGKSLFAKLLAIRAIEQGFPLLIVDNFYPEIATFLESIEQEVVILFDEFDKSFGNGFSLKGDSAAQTSMLSLFDGIAQGKKLFIITCNEISRLNDYLINRPGRFHYHFRFEYPSAMEIREYLEDKIEKEYYKEIDKVITFSEKINLNYDCLRAIAFELNTGEPFETAIHDLNILNMHEENYNLKLYFEDGTSLEERSARLDLFNDSQECAYFSDEERHVLNVQFNPRDCVYDVEKKINLIRGENLEIEFSDRIKNNRFRKLKVTYMSITKRRDKALHYVA